MPLRSVRISRRQGVETSLAWAVLLFRAFVVPMPALAFDWMALAAAYWIFCVFGQDRRAWPVVTAVLAAWLAVGQLLAWGRPES